MKVKLCTQCPYTPPDLAGHYDPNAFLHVCTKCDSQLEASTNHYPRKADRRQKCATVPSISVTAQPNVAQSVTEGLVSSGTIPGELLSVQGSALIASGSAGKMTADGYPDFTLHEDGYRETPATISGSSGFRSKEVAQ